MKEAAELVVWLIGLFGFVGIVIALTAKMVIHDSFRYDELYVWRRKLPKEVRPK
ncbi:hypothetical protein [Paenibacillus nasutitermitis]|uniref:Uncharacterized protein n=1 Tax=Paenibacillus nasutitermitis TaxID=1652958 RepID=A0A916Z0T8_9BACL|nr:hypothetical protein [Paenibacillus nasutitermitis]GGD70606.1 hypothetical protein GCM10010911_30590 [Paenibacillus nasutitermitis]